MHVDNLGGSMFSDIIDMLVGVPRSSAQFIWYLFSLFTITLFTLLISRITTSPFILIMIALAFFWSPPILFAYLFKTQTVAVFFYLGGIAAIYGDAWREALKGKLMVLGFIFAFFVFFTRLLEYYQLSIFLCGLTGSLFLHSVCLNDYACRSSILAFLGKYSFSIYLMNMIFIGLAKGILVFLNWDDFDFILYAPVLLASGILGPIFVKLMFFKRIPLMDRYTS
jgi:hypothetical protein